MENKLITAGIIYNENGEILVTQRASNDSCGNGWEFPGGKIEPGEQPTDALLREIQEELEADIEVDSIFDAVFYSYEKFSVFIVFYKCRLINNSDIKLNVHQNYKWVKPEKINEVEMLPADVPVSKKIAKEAIL